MYWRSFSVNRSLSTSFFMTAKGSRQAICLLKTGSSLILWNIVTQLGPSLSHPTTTSLKWWFAGESAQCLKSWPQTTISPISGKLNKCAYMDTVVTALMADLYFGFCFHNPKFLIWRQVIYLLTLPFSCARNNLQSNTEISQNVFWKLMRY